MGAVKGLSTIPFSALSCIGLKLSDLMTSVNGLGSRVGLFISYTFLNLSVSKLEFIDKGFKKCFLASERSLSTFENFGLLVTLCLFVEGSNFGY